MQVAGRCVERARAGEAALEHGEIEVAPGRRGADGEQRAVGERRVAQAEEFLVDAAGADDRRRGRRPSCLRARRAAVAVAMPNSVTQRKTRRKRRGSPRPPTAAARRGRFCAVLSSGRRRASRDGFQPAREPVHRGTVPRATPGGRRHAARVQCPGDAGPRAAAGGLHLRHDRREVPLLPVRLRGPLRAFHPRL